MTVHDPTRSSSQAVSKQNKYILRGHTLFSIFFCGSSAKRLSRIVESLLGRRLPPFGKVIARKRRTAVHWSEVAASSWLLGSLLTGGTPNIGRRTLAGSTASAREDYLVLGSRVSFLRNSPEHFFG